MEKLSQWYISNPDRFEEEVRLMNEHFPLFKQSIDENGKVCWIGEVDFQIEESNGEVSRPDCEYNPLLIKIECGDNYPAEFPTVYDVNNILRRHGCVHLHPETEKICYRTRLDEMLDFEEGTRIKDLAGFIGGFLYGQWKAENNGGKWENDRLHGATAFLQHEFLNGSIPSSDKCPCGKNNTYINCCLKLVETMIKKNSSANGFSTSGIKLKGYRICPCGSGEKFRRCCQAKGLYGERKFYLQILPLKKVEFLEFLRKISKQQEMEAK